MTGTAGADVLSGTSERGRDEREPYCRGLACPCGRRRISGCTARGAAGRAVGSAAAVSARRARSARRCCVADVAGLVLVVRARKPARARRGATGDRVSPGFEYLAFLLAIPGWLLLLRLEGLYDRDEERTDHSTVDDIVGVFRSVTIGVWIFALFGVATHLVQPVLGRLGVFWLAAVVLIPTLRAVARTLCRHLPGYDAERGHRRRGARRPAARPQAD